jgi:hypothetical protein
MSPLYFRTEQFGGSDDWHAIDYLVGPPLSTAATTSARFPVISPPGYYISRNVVPDGSGWREDKTYRGRKNRYVDGGYFDNSATPTLMEIFRALYAFREEFLELRPERKTFSMRTLHIGNAPTCEMTAPAGEVTACKPSVTISTYSGGLSEILGVVGTVMNVRDARVEYSLRQFETEVERASDSSINTLMKSIGTDRAI